MHQISIQCHFHFTITRYCDGPSAKIGDLFFDIYFAVAAIALTRMLFINSIPFAYLEHKLQPTPFLQTDENAI